MFLATAILAACSQHGDTNSAPPRVTQSVASCLPCVTDLDCAGAAECGQFSGDTFCAATCDEVACADGTTCTIVTTYAGDEASLCVPDGNACGVSVAAKKAKDAGVADAGSCGALISPGDPASCTGCGTAHASECQPNGCYGGWYCDTAARACTAPPTSACATDAGATPVDAGTVATDAGSGGTLSGSGGTVDDLVFAIIGDTRPPVIDDTAGYPVAVITQVFSRVATSSPAPLFGVSTGDYQFSTATGTQAPAQIQKYLEALDSTFKPGSFPLFPAMGNHECTGATNSNCGPEGKDGTTNNFTAFHDLLLSRVGQSLPYYRVDIGAKDGSWTAKFVFVAANYWGPTQSAWLDAALSDATTYTFVVRHESSTATTAPGVSPSQKIIAAHPLTMEIVGHEHSFGRVSQQEVLVGNGGAPLTGTAYYGFALVQRQGDGSVRFDMVNASTGAVDPTFGFAVKADGTTP